MIQECKTYLCDYPNDEDIMETMKIVKRDKCVIKLMWMDVNGAHCAVIDANSTLESVKGQISIVYGV